MVLHMTQSYPELRVCVDVGSSEHYAGIGLSSGQYLEEFRFSHTPEGIRHFFHRIAELNTLHNASSVAVAMEGYNGYARPIDTMVLEKNYKLYNVNNTKLARYKEVFSGPAKSDPIDTRKMFELFTMKDSLPLAKNALQEVIRPSETDERLKRFTRRRRDLVNEKVAIVNRLQSDLLAICPGILAITGSVDNLWFLNFLTFSKDITKLVRLQKSSLLKIKGVGKKYAEIIQVWQKIAEFSSSATWVGEMVIQDAMRILELLSEIDRLDASIEDLIPKSIVASRIKSIPGFGLVCSGELGGEIGNINRFKGESSLALYVGMGVLSNQSGKYSGTKRPRSVNTRAKAAMMVAVARHISQNTEAKTYYDKKRAEGKKHNQAIRSLGRHLVRVMWSMLKNCRDYELREKKGSI